MSQVEKTYEVFCLKCKEKTVHHVKYKIVNGRKVPEIDVLPNGQQRVRVICSRCGTKAWKFLSAKGLRPVSSIIRKEKRRRVRDESELERIYKVSEDLGVYKASEVLGISPSQIYRLRRKYLEMKKADIEMLVDEFDKAKRHQEFISWLKNQNKNWKDILRIIKDIWVKVWNKKHLDLLTESDIINAKNYLRDRYGDKHFNQLVAIRYVIRYGFGKSEWLAKHLRTKGTKHPPKIPVFLKTIDFYDNKLPAILQEIYSLDDLELKVILLLKIYSGIRTGNRKEERGLWGLRVGTGKSYIYLTESDRIIHVYEKWGEEWDITYLPNRLWNLLRELLKQRKYGDYLIQDHSSSYAIKVLNKIFKKYGIDEKVDLHTLRKISLSLSYIVGIPLEDATDINVGWKDLSTAKNHYKGLRAIPLTKEKRLELIKKLDLEHLKPLSWIL